MKIKTGLFIWLVPSERRNGTHNKELENLRKRLYYRVRYTEHCVHVDDSVYLITDESQIPTLQAVAKEFKEEYERLGYKAFIDVVEYERSEKDLAEMLEMSFMTLLSQRIQDFEKAYKEGRTVSPLTLKKSNDDIYWIKGDCGRFNVNTDKLQSFIEILEEKIADHEQIIGRSTKAMKWEVA